MSTEEKLGRMRERFGESAAEAAYEAARAKAAAEFDAKLAMVPTGSPIERLLVAQMLVDRWHLHPAGATYPVTLQLLYSPAVTVVPQFKVRIAGKRCRVDFLFAAGDLAPSPTLLIVELDGHDFHERTKEQASADRKRDRAMLSRGITTIRFTGSDVYRDPKTVLDECVATVRHLAKARK